MIVGTLPEPVIPADYSALQLSIDKLTNLAKKIGEEKSATEKTAAYVKEMVASGRFDPFALKEQFKHIEHHLTLCVPGPYLHLAKQGLLTTIAATFEKITEQLNREAMEAVYNGDADKVERLLKVHHLNLGDVFKFFQHSKSPRIHELLILTGLPLNVKESVISKAIETDNPEWLELSNKYLAGQKLSTEDFLFDRDNFRAFDIITDSGMSLSEEAIFHPNSGFSENLGYRLFTYSHIFSYIFNGGKVSSTPSQSTKKEEYAKAAYPITAMSLRISGKYFFSLLKQWPAMVSAIPVAMIRPIIADYVGTDIVMKKKNILAMRKWCYTRLNHEIIDELHQKAPSPDLGRMRRLDLSRHPFEYLNQSPAFAEHVNKLFKLPDVGFILRTAMKAEGEDLQKWMEFITAYYEPVVYNIYEADYLFEGIMAWTQKNLDTLSDNGIKLKASVHFSDGLSKPKTLKGCINLPASLVLLIPALLLNGIEFSNISVNSKKLIPIAARLRNVTWNVAGDYAVGKLKESFPQPLMQFQELISHFWYSLSDFTSNLDLIEKDRKAIRQYVYNRTNGLKIEEIANKQGKKAKNQSPNQCRIA